MQCTGAQVLRNLKVLDFSMGVAGPHAALLCAQNGASVVKIESLEGDWCRTLGTRVGDLSPFFITYNRGKRSVAIDTKTPAGRDAVLTMANQADVIIEAFRPGVMNKLGFGYDAIAKSNPKVVYLSVNGFGSTGPMMNAPATDVVLQGFAGLMNMNRDADGIPQRIDHVLIDVITGLYGFQNILTALMARHASGGNGRHLECTMLGSAMAFQAGKILEDAMQVGERLWFVPQGGFFTSDGQISLSVRRDDAFARMCEALGRADIMASGKFDTVELRLAHADELLSILRDDFKDRTTAALSAVLTKADILHAPINTYASLLAHEQVQATDSVYWGDQNGIDKPLPFPKAPGVMHDEPLSDAPHIGQHTHEALSDWGISDNAIAALVACNAIAPAARPPS
jgi:crotonobetainyl-CoA:carnitine CoA-transferase CaiB-like acyl-CoA transferase